MNGLIDENHRIELQMWVDTLFMCKVLHKKGIETPEYSYNEQYTATVFWMCMDELSKATGFFSFTSILSGDDTKHSIELHLERAKDQDKEIVLSSLKDCFNQSDDFGSEIHAHVSMGELVIDVEHTFIFGKVLEEVVRWLDNLGATFDGIETGGAV